MDNSPHNPTSSPSETPLDPAEQALPAAVQRLSVARVKQALERAGISYDAPAAAGDAADGAAGDQAADPAATLLSTGFDGCAARIGVSQSQQSFLCFIASTRTTVTADKAEQARELANDLNSVLRFGRAAVVPAGDYLLLQMECTVDCFTGCTDRQLDSYLQLALASSMNAMDLWHERMHRPEEPTA